MQCPLIERAQLRSEFVLQNVVCPRWKRIVFSFRTEYMNETCTFFHHECGISCNFKTKWCSLSFKKIENVVVICEKGWIGASFRMWPIDSSLATRPEGSFMILILKIENLWLSRRFYAVLSIYTTIDVEQSNNSALRLRIDFFSHLLDENFFYHSRIKVVRGGIFVRFSQYRALKLPSSHRRHFKIVHIYRMM